MSKKILIFIIFLAIAIPVIKGKVEVPTDLTMSELISFAKRVWAFWAARIKSVTSYGSII